MAQGTDDLVAGSTRDVDIRGTLPPLGWGVRVDDAPFHARGPIATAGGCLASQYLAVWMMVRGAGLDAATRALHSAAPVGDKDAYVARLLDVVLPFIQPDTASA